MAHPWSLSPVNDVISQVSACTAKVTMATDVDNCFVAHSHGCCFAQTLWTMESRFWDSPDSENRTHSRSAKFLDGKNGTNIKKLLDTGLQRCPF